MRTATLVTALFCASAPWLAAQETKLTAEQIERFLAEGKVVSQKSLGVGVTNSVRVKLQHEMATHDAHVQSIDESKATFTGNQGTELGFRDCYKFNVAAYKLDGMLGLNMTPPSVERKWGGKSSAFTWWVPNAMMEAERIKKGIKPPDPDLFNKQMYVVRVFDQLVFNVDRNLQNLLITEDWRLWMIDHTRCFRLRKDLNAPKNLVRCERSLLAKLRTLDFATLKAELGTLLRENEIKGMIERRDKIVALFDAKIKAEGEETVLYDLPARERVWVVPAQAQ
ncbi:MAG TPA: hypothetical protein DEH78_12105 [Solibacterales bacterium]|nr:hypothetical protein [Bryobacterales bacterium]